MPKFTPAKLIEPRMYPGNCTGWLIGAVDVGRGGDRDKDDADRQQTLLEIACVIEAAKKQPLQHDAAQRRCHKRDR